MTSTIGQYAEYLNKSVFYKINNLYVPVKVLDIKAVFGRMDFLITPINGEGQVWVTSSNIVSEQLKTKGV